MGWDYVRHRRSQKPTSDGIADIFYPSTITLGAAPSLQTGLYLADISFNLNTIEKDRHTEIPICLFNGTNRTIDFVGLSGRVTFRAGDVITADSQMKGELPEPSVSPSIVRSVAPLTEWILAFSQHVPSQEANKIPAILRAHPLHFELSQLDIQIAAHNEPTKTERLKMWTSVTYKRGFKAGRVVS
jgi:hypothetical protein